MDDYDIAAFHSAITKFRKQYNITEPIVSPQVPALFPGRVHGPRLHGSPGGDRNSFEGSYWRVERQIPELPRAVVEKAFASARTTR